MRPSIKPVSMRDAPRVVVNMDMAALAIGLETTEDAIRDRIIADLSDRQPDGRGAQPPFDWFNRVRVAGEKRPKTIAEIHVTLPGSVSFDDMHEAEALGGRVTLVDTDGAAHDLEDCTPFGTPATWYGRIFRDPHGQLWLHGAPAAREEALDIEPDGWQLRRLEDAISPGLAAALRDGGDGDLEALLPLEAEIGLAVNKSVLAWIGHAHRVTISDEIFEGELDDPVAEAEMSAWEARRNASYDLAAAQLAREARIGAIFDRVVTPERLSFVKDGVTFPIGKEELSAHRRKTIHQARSPMDDLAYELVDAYRAEGLLAPCPNNRGRGIGEMEAWNDWVAGDDLSDRMFARMVLPRAPAFDVLGKSFISASVDIEMEKEKALSPDGKVDYRDRIDFEITEADADREIAATIDYARRAFSGETISIADMADTVTCDATGERLRILGSYFAPVLMAPDAHYDHHPVPEVEIPKLARHLELSLPSGELVMADWFRIEGFNEGLEALVDEPRAGFSINDGKGLDDRMRAYYERAGLAIVQVGNSSPAAHEAAPGLWRLGYFDEDHDAFWTEDGKRTDQPMPHRAWSTCTDLWANTFAAPETIVDILMASDVYPDRDAAERALSDYVETTLGASRIDIGSDVLHLYAPTGPATHGDRFASEFRAAELGEEAWFEDMYVLSTRPLTVAPDLLEECDWQERARETPDAAPEP